jgi:hypothetical protein
MLGCIAYLRLLKTFYAYPAAGVAQELIPEEIRSLLYIKRVLSAAERPADMEALHQEGLVCGLHASAGVQGTVDLHLMCMYHKHITDKSTAGAPMG